MTKNITNLSVIVYSWTDLLLYTCCCESESLYSSRCHARPGFRFYGPVLSGVYLPSTWDTTSSPQPRGPFYLSIWMTFSSSTSPWYGLSILHKNFFNLLMMWFTIEVDISVIWYYLTERIGLLFAAPGPLLGFPWWRTHLRSSYISWNFLHHCRQKNIHGYRLVRQVEKL